MQPHDYISEHYSTLLTAVKFIHASQYLYGRGTVITALLQVRKPKTERLGNLPNDTQLGNCGAQIPSRQTGCRATFLTTTLCSHGPESDA